MQQIQGRQLETTPVQKSQSEDWSISLRAIFELILLDQSKLAQATALALANAYRETDEFVSPQVLQCSRKLWKIAKYMDILNKHQQQNRYADAVDTIQPALQLCYELQQSDYFQCNHYQFLVHYICQRKLP